MNLEIGKTRLTKLKHKEKKKYRRKKEQSTPENFLKLMNDNKPQFQEA